MKLLLFAGSLRKESLNRKFLRSAQKMLEDQKISTSVADLAELNFPVYSGDIEAVGIPESVKKMAQWVSSHDGIVLSTPEYNGSIASPVKNTIDWVSRIQPMPWKGKPLLLLGASPGALGAVRGLLHTRQPFEVTGAYVLPEMMGLPRAHLAFNEAGELNDEKTRLQLSKLIVTYIEFVKTLTESKNKSLQPA